MAHGSWLILSLSFHNWLRQRYGNDVYESIKINRIICTGTVWGTTHEFMTFTSAMEEHITSENYPYYRICDQAAGNWLIYHKNMFQGMLNPSTNNDGCVMTIGLTAPQDVHTASTGNVLNGKGEIASVIHQYDRNPAVINIVVRKYCADMSAFSKFRLKHNCDSLGDFLGRIMRFMSRVHKRGFSRSVLEAVKRRI